MNITRKLYPAVEARVLQEVQDKGQIHGSTVRDMFIEFAKGRFAVDDHAEKLLKALVEDRILKYTHKAPTFSQGAFIGLQYSAKAYQNVGWEPGVIEHFYYILAKPLEAVN